MVDYLNLNENIHIIYFNNIVSIGEQPIFWESNTEARERVIAGDAEKLTKPTSCSTKMLVYRIPKNIKSIIVFK